MTPGKPAITHISTMFVYAVRGYQRQTSFHNLHSVTYDIYDNIIETNLIITRPICTLFMAAQLSRHPLPPTKYGMSFYYLFRISGYPKCIYISLNPLWISINDYGISIVKLR